MIGTPSGRAPAGSAAEIGQTGGTPGAGWASASRISNPVTHPGRCGNSPAKRTPRAAPHEATASVPSTDTAACCVVSIGTSPSANCRRLSTQVTAINTAGTAVANVVATPHLATTSRVAGFTRQAMIGIKTRGDVSGVAKAICEIPQVDYVVTTAGSYDLLVELVCEDDAELLDVLMTRIRTLDGITDTETFVYLKLNKQHYDWGTR